jgi:hypothetical protein
MKYNEKCQVCVHKEIRGQLIINTTEQGEIKKDNLFCDFKRINLNNVIVKNCSSFKNYKERLQDSENEFAPSEIF